MRTSRKKIEPFANYTTHVMRCLGMEPDPWQMQVLEGEQQQLLLNCSRQAGKSTVVAIMALVEALLLPRSMVLLLAPSERQSKRLFLQLMSYYKALGSRFQQRATRQELEIENGSQIVSLPCKEQTIRGYAGVTLLIIDEAARVPDEVYKAVRPMLAVTEGRIICMSTPWGRRGFFYNAWARGGAGWTRIEVPVDRVPRIKPETVEEARRELGESYVRQEYYCSFEAQEGLVYRDFARQVSGGRLQDEKKAWAYGKKVGGIDFGFRDPFAAVWGVLDSDGVLWLCGELYQREQTLSALARELPRDVLWAADPAEPGLIRELLSADVKVRKASNERELGFAAMRGRLERGALRVIEGRCPNLLAEAELYRHGAADDARPGKRRETSTDGSDHAMDALRYLVMMLDRNKVARSRGWFGQKDVAAPASPDLPAAPAKKKRWLSIRNEELWTPVCTIPKW